jgi:hypothetical protein
MPGTALDKVAGYLDKRFVLTALFPALAFWLSALVLVGTQEGWSESLRWWHERDADEQRLLVVGAIAIVVLSASLLAVQVGAITRLYEGYWGDGAVGTVLVAPGLALQRRRFDALDLVDDVAFERRYRMFPRTREDLLPTRLGNVFRGAEKYPGDVGRYGIDAVFFWPRLHAVLGDSTRAALADARSSMDLLLTASALALVFGVGSGAYLALASGPAVAWLLAVGGSLLIGWLAYRGTVSAAVVYAENVRAAFDLHRLDLLDQLGYERPTTLDEERAIWKALAQRLYRRGEADGDALRYSAGQAEA